MFTIDHFEYNAATAGFRITSVCALKEFIYVHLIIFNNAASARRAFTIATEKYKRFLS